MGELKNFLKYNKQGIEMSRDGNLVFRVPSSVKRKISVNIKMIVSKQNGTIMSYNFYQPAQPQLFTLFEGLCYKN